MSLLIALTSAAPSIGQSDEFVTRTTRDLAVAVRPWNWPILVGLLLSCLGISASPASACNIPVFRYALENWQPDFYHVLVITRRPLESEEQMLVERLHNAGAGKQHPANLQVVVVNLNEKKASEAMAGDMRGKRVPREAFDALDTALGKMDIETPQMVVLYPSQFDHLAWSAELTEETVDRLIDSPARQALGERLLSGDSAVWVMIESGRSEDDQAAWNQLNQYLSSAEKLVKLPQRELIETDEFYRSDVAIDLKVEFSALRLSREDPMEAAFISMLLGSEEDLNEFDEPIVVPIYGRGRSYFALVGKGIKEDMVIDNCQFLCGACSCQVKQDNPGVDMLMAVSWEERVTQQGSAAPPLPQLTGVGGLEMAALPTSGTPTPASDNSAVNSLANSPNTISDPGDELNSPSLNPSDAASGSSDANGTNGAKVTSATGPHSPLDMPPSAELGFSWRLIAIVCGAVALAVVALMSMARGF